MPTSVAAMPQFASRIMIEVADRPHARRFQPDGMRPRRSIQAASSAASGASHAAWTCSNRASNTQVAANPRQPMSSRSRAGSGVRGWSGVMAAGIGGRA